jgi:ABC-2 type transport system ATP-binding protein
VGVPRARLQLAHTSPGDLYLFGKVFDVAPDGSAELIHRLVSPVRVPAGAVGEPVELNLIGFAHRFDAGHRVRWCWPRPTWPTGTTRRPTSSP